MKISLGLLVIILSFALISGQTPSSPTQDDQVIRTRSNEVRLDVIIKDKKGRPVKDLTDADFEVTEDGTPQRIESFRFVSRETSVGGATVRKDDKGGSLTPPPASTTPGVIALVFDRLSPDARSLARKAGLAYARDGIANGDFTGVFGIDQSLRTLQSFTDNPELVKQAVDSATNSASSTYTNNSAKMRTLADQNIALDQEAAGAQSAASAAGAARDGGGASAAGAAGGQAAQQQKFIEMETNMLEQAQTLERDQQGFATINSLLAVINPMRSLPGRKTLIFFSEGLALPSSVQAKFPSVISAANRANVSIYAIDAAGLRIESGQSEAAQEINSMASKRMQQASRGNDSGVSGAYTKALERNEDLLRLDPRSGLGALADQTGGFLIHDTNDLAAGVRRISDDMRGYYMITYVPTNRDYNGRFRQINVKLKRANFEVQARRGYYAVESLGQLALLDFEAPALAAAQHARSESSPASLRAGALSFPATNRAGLALILVDTPMSAFTFANSNDKKTYNADFSIVGLVRDQSDLVVQKLSQHYPLSGPIDSLEAARKGDLIFYRETQLPPGKYTVEMIAFDALTGKVSVRTSPLEIPSNDETKPRLSSVAVIKRADRLTAEEQKRDQPFHFGELLVYPNLGEPILRSTARQLAFFCTVWPAKGQQGTPPLTIEIMQHNRRLGQSATQLPTADQQGQIKYASSFPVDKFQPGVYELRVTVGAGKDSVSRSTDFTIAP